MLALIFRGAAHWTTGFAFERALHHLGVPFAHLNNNDIWDGRVSLSDFDAALTIDDGFALKPRVLPNMPVNSAYFAIDLHNAPEDYLPYLHQFKRIYCAQYTYGSELVRQAGLNNVEFLPLAWDSLGIPYQEKWVFNQRNEREPIRPIPITFVASWSTETRIYLREIVNYKYGGVAREMFHEELGKTLSSSKIGLNVIGGVGHKQFFSHVAQRPYEVMGNGSLLIQQDLWNAFTGERIDDFERIGFVGAEAWFRNADATHHFWDRRPLQGNENCVLWRDASQLLYTLDYYLAEENEQERAEIAKRGQEFVTNNHTYVHRVRKILGDMGIPC